MDSTTIIALVTALAALLGAASPIIVSLIQSNKGKSEKPSGIYVPETYVLHQPKKQIRWFVVLFYAILGGAIGYSGTKLASTNTNVSPLTETATATSTIPSILEKPTPTPTATIPATPTTILLQDDFIDNRNDWLLLDTQFIKSNILGGKYKHVINCPIEYEAFYCGHYFLVPNLVHKDLQFEIESTLIEVSPSNAEVMIAFQFRRNDNNYYDVYFRSIGLYTVNILNNGSLNKLLANTVLDGFSQNSNTTNRYGFSAVHSTITPIFNGTELLTVEDGNLNQAGSVYLVIFVARGSSAIIEMDNLLVIDRSAY